MGDRPAGRRRPTVITLDQAGRGTPSARVFPPPDDLRPFVEHSWIQHDLGLCDGLWRIVPDASPHIVYSRIAGSHSRRRPGDGRLAVVGPRTVYVDADVAQRSFTVGFRLRPGALPLLTGLPAAELADRSVRADELLATRGRDAVERAADATGPTAVHGEIIELLRALFTARGGIEARVTATADALSRGAGDRSMGRVARELAMGERTLRWLARAEIGLAPKRIARVYRVQRALTLGLRGPPGRWARIAAQVGYHDQPHLIRDFHILLGETPEDFLRRGIPRRATGHRQADCRLLQSSAALDL